MKDIFLALTALIISINLLAATVEYGRKASELAEIERIAVISNLMIENDAINAELGKLSDVELAEALGL